MYEFCYPACNSKYIGKTDRNFGTCVQEHSGSDKKSPANSHLLECPRDCIFVLQSQFYVETLDCNALKMYCKVQSRKH